MNGIEKMPDIKIVPATPEDAGSIQQLLRASVLATCVNEERGITAEDMEERYRSQFSPEGIEKIARDLAEPSPGTTYLVAKENDAVIGYCKITENQEEKERFRSSVDRTAAMVQLRQFLIEEKDCMSASENSFF